MTVKPLFDKVVVERIEQEEKTEAQNMQLGLF